MTKINLERLSLAKKRIGSVLRKHAVAPMRTLEQKISDAGPFGQRIDPHILTSARKELVRADRLLVTQRNNVPWFHLPGVNSQELQARLEELGSIYDRATDGDLTKRSGQTLEIAIYRALATQNSLEFFGGFRDLEDHDDSTLFSKEDPPKIVSGKSMPGDKRLDFLVWHSSLGRAGLEAKNVREWLYPDRTEVMDLLEKCCSIDAVPVLIARRIHYSTFSILNPTGVIIHQTYNQLYPYADAGLADLVRRKDLLGYHDVRVGNEPDARLRKFLTKDLPSLMVEARERFSNYADLLQRYGNRDIPYERFAWQVRRRQKGESEDEFPSDYDPRIEDGSLPF